MRDSSRLLVLLVLGTTSAPFASTVHGAPGDGAAQAAQIEISPRRVYPRSTARLRFHGPAATEPMDVRWEADGGLLLSDDLNEVEWKAPVKEGAYSIRVFAAADSSATKPRQALSELRVSVEKPSSEGMIWIPPGTFLRGDIRGSANLKEVKTLQNACDEPAYLVHLDGYWMDKYPVTHSRYTRFLSECLEQGLARVEDIAVMGYIDGAWVPFYYFHSYEKLVPYYHDTRNARKPHFLHAISHDAAGFHIRAGWEDSPVVDVSWFGADAFARFYGKMLPSEAQWEKAARGLDSRRFPWGDTLPTSYHVATYSSYPASGSPPSVGRRSPAGDSPFGVADMLSSLFEWSNDWFNPDYYQDYQGVTPLRNPSGPFWGRSHTIRGSPYGVQFPQVSFDESEPVSTRYSWIFEFEIGDAFANRNTTFRTVLPAVPVSE